MHISRIGFYSAVAGGKIYAIGGTDPHNNEGGSMVGVLASVEEYDPVTNKWTIKAPMIDKKELFQTAVVNGKIYVIGGWNDIKYGDQAANYLSSVQEYDPQTNTWAEKSPLKIGRRDVVTAVVGDSIYAIGGLVGPDRGGAGTALVEEYTTLP
jgi:N-acetylneuraminic acid mutarotase